MAHYPNNLNPFMDDFEDDTESYYSMNMEPPQYDPPPPPGRFVNMKLPAFWSDAPVAWFAAVEAQFQLRQVTSQSERFCHLTAALDKASLKKVVHIVTTPDPLQPYTVLKEALLTSHHMTDFQRVELLNAMEPLGGRKPSELLADMLELCPPTQHNNVFFAVLFLQRLPREIRVLLTHEDHTDLRRLAAPRGPPGRFRWRTTVRTCCYHRRGHRGEHRSSHQGETHPTAAEEQAPEAAALQTAAATSPAAKGRPERHNQPASFQPGAAVFWPVFLPLGPW